MFSLRHFLLTTALLVGGGFFILKALNGKEMFFPRLGDKPLSEKVLQKREKKIDDALTLNPEQLDALVERGILYYLRGPEHYADALNALTLSWQLGGLDVRIFYYSGILYENLSLFDEARRQYERFLRHDPQDREIRLRLARLLARSEQWDLAAQSYQKFLEKNPKDQTALANLGLVYYSHWKENVAQAKRKKPDAAFQQTTEALATQALSSLEKISADQKELPGGVPMALAELYFARGAYDKTLEMAAKEKAQNPQNEAALLLLATTYEKQNNLESARDTYQALSQLNPKVPAYTQKTQSFERRLRKKPAAKK